MINVSPEAGILIFRSVVSLFIFSLQFFLYRRTARWITSSFPALRWPLPVARTLFIIFNIAALFAILQHPTNSDIPSWFMYGGVYPYLVWHGATFFIGVIVLLTSFVKLPFKAFWWAVKNTRRVYGLVEKRVVRLQSARSFQRFDASRRTFLRRGMYGLSAVSFGGTTYGLAYEKSTCETTEVNFSFSGLAQNLDGFTIGLISDIHSSVFMGRREMEKYVQLVNDLGTDLIVVVGDFVNSRVEEVYPFAEAFSNLRAACGVYGVMGNHEFYAQNPELVAKEVEACGIKLLRNDKTVIQKGDGAFYLIGVDDTGRAATARSMMETALGNTPLAIPRILLCHRPYFLPEASQSGIDLMLSGHTHGGQVVLGRFGTTTFAPASLASKYVWGEYHEGGTSMYVSRGIGTVGLPVRINCPPEITRVILRSGSTS